MVDWREKKCKDRVSVRMALFRGGSGRRFRPTTCKGAWGGGMEEERMSMKSSNWLRVAEGKDGERRRCFPT